MFKKILISNRGEIALRLINACREMNILAVAIYSDPDSKSLFVENADEAYPLNGVEAKETYLDIEKIIQIAKESKTDAIHPGYGFLSENAAFAEACEKAKIKFIGPSPKMIRELGSKTKAKEIAKKANVATVPGYQGEIPRGKELKKITDEIGYPLLVKAAAGGGGKGMKIVSEAKDLEETIESAEREALAFFKDKTLFLEKYIENPRHIEVQILGDEKGNLIHLFERECSVQRRHQKMIEESPSPSIDEKFRNEICEAALKIGKAANYFSAGTVEFIVDQKNNFYFLEVNTRLQVEHPVTELVTGVDLVKEQIRIAAGEKLSLKQSDLLQRGHSIECRLYAEDPENNFLPVEGSVGLLDEPKRPGVRIDSGLKQGQEILPFYDPMLAKLIVWGADRAEALEKIDALLRDYTLLGVRHNLDFLRYLIQSNAFQKGFYHTHSVAELLEDFKKTSQKIPEMIQKLLPSLSKKTQKISKPGKRDEFNLLNYLEGFRNV